MGLVPITPIFLIVIDIWKLLVPGLTCFPRRRLRLTSSISVILGSRHRLITLKPSVPACLPALRLIQCQGRTDFRRAEFHVVKSRDDLLACS